jgi:ribosome biogenesis GTPase
MSKLSYSSPSNLKEGTVVASQANFYQVRLDSSPDTLLCTRPTRLKKVGQSVLVGDRVLIKSSEGERGAIAQVLPRQTEFKRPPIANAEQILLVFALQEPILDAVQLSRFLIQAEYSNLKLILVLNKVDLISRQEQEQWLQRLNSWGYNPLFISVNTGVGIKELKSLLSDRISILTGPSGVGKSSLASLLIPELELRTNTVSGKLQKGRHTTRHVQLYELPEGGYIADSPGFNQPHFDFSPEQLINYFPEVKAKLENHSCRFYNCFHRDEPDCAIKGEWERYEYYLRFLDEVIAHAQKMAQTKDQESSVKTKFDASGKKYTEPKLESKKYRRVSRKTKNQNLEDLYSHQLLDEDMDWDF